MFIYTLHNRITTRKGASVHLFVLICTKVKGYHKGASIHYYVDTHNAYNSIGTASAIILPGKAQLTRGVARSNLFVAVKSCLEGDT